MDVGNSPPEFSDRCLAARAPEAQLDGKQQVLVAVIAIAVSTGHHALAIVDCVQNRAEAKRSNWLKSFKAKLNDYNAFQNFINKKV